jgi:redox-sensing transcriptional repressor
LPGRRVSERTIRRLSHYAGCLRLSKARGEPVMTSGRLAEACSISAAAVRKDLALFGDFGKKGSGYDVPLLLRSIETILGVEDPPSVVIVGAGNIGLALLESGLAGAGGYHYAEVFDADPAKVGMTCCGLQIRPLEEMPFIIRNLGEAIAVLAVTHGEGQASLDRIVDAGCKAVLSFNLEPLTVPEGVFLRYVEVSTELDILTHSIRNSQQNKHLNP